MSPRSSSSASRPRARLAARLAVLLAGTLLAAGGCPGELDPGAGDGGARLPDGVAPGGDGGAPAPDAAPTIDARGWPEHYPEGRTHSPVSPSVVAAARAIAAAASQAPDVFMKVGDSHTASAHYLRCFAGADVNLAGHTDLEPTLAFFGGGRIGDATPYDRESLAAVSGWATYQVLGGDPSPLEAEIAAAGPRYATVMLGTNDIGYDNILRFGDDMVDIAQVLIAAGVVPIFSSIPPRDDSAAADAWVPRYNAVVRGVAQAFQVPFIDLHRELLELPGHGLAGDGVHLNTYYSGAGARPCDFGVEGVTRGNNLRNLLVLEALDRALGAVDAGHAPDGANVPVIGSGTFVDPIVIPGLPFGDMRDTRTDGERRVAVYGGCSQADEGGAEVYYRLDVSAPTRIRGTVFSRGDSDIDIHLLGAAGTAESCVARDHTTIEADVDVGTWLLALDTFVDAESGELAGPYLLVVNREP